MTTTMTTTMTTAAAPAGPQHGTSREGVLDAEHVAYRLVAVDLYRDIHKGIRSELFALTSSAGSLDPSDRCGRLALADHVAAVDGVLRAHAEHEDAHVDPPLAEHLPQLAEQIQADHHAFDGQFDVISAIAAELVDTDGPSPRRLAHLLYLELAQFTGRYLAHQDLEERVVMPALERALGVDAVAGIHLAIVGSIPPEEMVRSLALMLPAMNLDDRAEMLQGMRAAAPPEAFAGVVGLARSVLVPADFTALATRLGLA